VSYAIFVFEGALMFPALGLSGALGSLHLLHLLRNISLGWFCGYMQ